MSAEDFTKIRKYRWSLITYASPNEFLPLILSADHYAYIYHNLDNAEPHFHILLTFTQQISLSRIRKYITSDQNTLGEPLRENFAMFSYLTHENLKAEEKEVYNREDIKTDSTEFWLSQKNKKNNDNEMFVNDLMNLSPVAMAIKYGRDYIKNFDRYNTFRSTLITMERSTEDTSKLDF